MMAECPFCGGQGVVPTGDHPCGDNPEEPCPMCEGAGSVPQGCRDVYVATENELWQAKQRIAALEDRLQELHGHEIGWLQMDNAQRLGVSASRRSPTERGYAS